MGDQLLQLAGAIFNGRIRGSDTVARTGGDEFSVILEDAADRASATNVANSLLRYLNAPLQLQGRTVWVGASIGVAIFPDDGEDIESLCIAADLRMYAEKNEAKSANRLGMSERIPPQTASEGTTQADFRVAPERSSA
jgi:diguanylate cyclase (GGDEF)-like protein